MNAMISICGVKLTREILPLTQVNKQECIPVGCLPPACRPYSVVSHFSQGRGSAQPPPVGRRGGLPNPPPDTDPPRCRPPLDAALTPRGRPPGGRPPPLFMGPVMHAGKPIPPCGQTPVKILPCPKLRLRAVTTQFNYLSSDMLE